jgi:hypothetical protein
LEVIDEQERNVYMYSTVDGSDIFGLPNIQNMLRNFILEIDFSQYRTLQLEQVAMDLCMAIPSISVEWAKDTEVVIMAILMMSQMSFGICLMTVHYIKVSLYNEV